MENVIVIAVVLAIVAAASWYIRREKKRGVKCVGCPSGGCAGCQGGCGCHGEET